MRFVGKHNDNCPNSLVKSYYLRKPGKYLFLENISVKILLACPMSYQQIMFLSRT